jgi:hypothetical protein
VQGTLAGQKGALALQLSRFRVRQTALDLRLVVRLRFVEMQISDRMCLVEVLRLEALKLDGGQRKRDRHFHLRQDDQGSYLGMSCRLLRLVSWQDRSVSRDQMIRTSFQSPARSYKYGRNVSFILYIVGGLRVSLGDQTRKATESGVVGPLRVPW